MRALSNRVPDLAWLHPGDILICRLSGTLPRCLNCRHRPGMGGCKKTDFSERTIYLNQNKTPTTVIVCEEFQLPESSSDETNADQ